MNLKDMLSSHMAQASLYNAQEPEMSSFLPQQDEVGPELLADEATPLQDVYYLPTLLTAIQRELIDATLHIFSQDLKTQIRAKNTRNSIESLLDQPEKESNGFGSHSLMFNNISLLFGQLTLIDSHPSLLVDHFIPKKLLLSEINSRLVSLSGKFQLFNRIVDSLIDGTDTGGFHLLVIAQSIKELELIESIIIGKQLYYENLSCSKLYTDTQEPPQPSKGSKGSLSVYLITSSQLYNHYMKFPSAVEFNLIFSFDMKLDVTNPSIQLLKSRSTSQLPIAIPVPLYSVSHLSLQIPEPKTELTLSNNDATNPVFKWKLQVLDTLVMNRESLLDTQRLDKDFFLKVYGRKMERFQKWAQRGVVETQIAKLMEPFDDSLTLRFSTEQVAKKLELEYPSLKKEEGEGVSDYSSFRMQLVSSISLKIDKMTLRLKDLWEDKLIHERTKESKRQLQYDADEDSISQNYLKLRKLNDQAIASEKKRSKAESDHSKNQERKDEVEYKLKTLQEIASKPTTPDNLRDQETIITKLKEELDNVSAEFTKLDEDNELVRQKYQASSATAVQLSSVLAKLSSQHAEIEAKLNGPGMTSLPSLIKKDTLLSMEVELNRVKKNTQFLDAFYKEKLEKLTKERQKILEASSSGSNSRPTNRISRGSTPL
ncbi:structural maintenance of chromosome protein 3 [Suhomyces tanzawaensis NRRL Y-17324]|uniref:Structural maintenance of chromosome protein 3 n=1 Tax=Suhomyces tanzawaensis NRRL Y-17324 TaxID=984487 RepID=A0A1E4SIB2_9ASCO|nr:structural maintenance of chromosome protein 3 [Suhomyces tanzawaensis NRRL Y-17324]ODV79254.1 structural maintenance of chromosome protein 3 [Suhomyces tanzawaensis NRRL Y-17324]